MSELYLKKVVLEKELVEQLAMSCYLLFKDDGMRFWPELSEEAKHVWREKARKYFLPIFEELRQNVVDDEGWLYELYERQCAITEAKDEALRKSRRMKRHHMIDIGDDFKIAACYFDEDNEGHATGLKAMLRISAYVMSLQSKVTELEVYVERTAKLEGLLQESQTALAELDESIKAHVPHLPDRLIEAWNRVHRMAIPLPKGWKK